MDIWDATLPSYQGQYPQKLKGNVEHIGAGAFSPDGGHLVSAGDGGSVQVWDSRSAAQTLRLKGYPSTVTSVGFSSDGRKIIAGMQNDIRMWDASTGEMLSDFRGHLEVVRAAWIIPGTDEILSASDDSSLRLWDIRSGQVSKELEPAVPRATDEFRTHTASISLDGTYGVSTGYFRSELNVFEIAELKLWDLRRGELLHDFGVNGGISTCPKGTSCLTATTASIIVTDPTGGNPNSAAISPDSTLILAQNYESIPVYDLASGRVLRELKGGGSFVVFPDQPYRCSWKPR